MPRPTHDEARDVGPAHGARFNYDLAPSGRAAPRVVKTNPHMRAGIGRKQRVNDSMLPGLGEAPNCTVIARSGNQGWDQDVYEAVGGVEEQAVGAEPTKPFNDPNSPNYDPGMPVAKGVVIGVAIIGLWVLLKGRRD